jgi:hypothetical protein
MGVGGGRPSASRKAAGSGDFTSNDGNDGRGPTLEAGVEANSGVIGGLLIATGGETVRWFEGDWTVFLAKASRNCTETRFSSSSTSRSEGRGAQAEPTSGGSLPSVSSRFKAA